MRCPLRAESAASVLCGALAATTLALGGAACRPDARGAPPADPPGTPVAWVGEEAVVAEEVELGRRRGTESRRTAVELAVADLLVAREARRRGLDQQEDVRAELEAVRRAAAARVRAVLREALVRELARDLRFSEAELKEHFEANRELYRRRLYTLRRAAFASKAEAEEAARRLEEGGSLDGQRFESIGPASLGEIPTGLQREVSRIRRAGGAVVVPEGERWWTVEVVDVETAEPASYDEVRRQLRATLRQERTREALEELVAELRAEATTRIDEEALADDSVWQERRRAVR